MGRYVVRTVRGYRNLTRTGREPGLSAHVLDSRLGYRIVATYRSEEMRLPNGGGHPFGIAEARRRAGNHARALNKRLGD